MTDDEFLNALRKLTVDERRLVLLYFNAMQGDDDSRDALSERQRDSRFCRDLGCALYRFRIALK